MIFAAWDEISENRVNSFFEFSNQVRNLSSSATDAYRETLLGSLSGKTKQEQFGDAARQTYIALWFALLAAAELKVDATPMEGFDSAEVDKLLNLTSEGLKSTVMMAVGYRDHENDWWSKLDRVRRPYEELFVEI